MIFFSGGGEEYFFAQLFLVLGRDILVISDNCFLMHMKHVQWSDNCILLCFVKSKTNQHGNKFEEPWYVYSKPDFIYLCPILSLAKYLLSQPNLLKGECKLFPGYNQYERFMRISHKVIKYHIGEFRVLGVEKGSLGSHLFRKGVIKLVSSGCTVSTPLSSICLRYF